MHLRFFGFGDHRPIEQNRTEQNRVYLIFGCPPASCLFWETAFELAVVETVFTARIAMTTYLKAIQP